MACELDCDEMCGPSHIVSKDTFLWLQLIAELLGTFFIVLFGCGSMMCGWSDDDAFMIVRVAFAFGLSVGAVVECIGHLSGGHVNPAVTVAMMLVRHVQILPGVLYVFAQILGALIAMGVLKTLVPHDLNPTFGLNTINDNLTIKQGFCVEMLITFLFILVVFAITDQHRKKRKGNATIIGLAVTVAHLFSIPYTGCGLNPARVFASAAIVNEWTNHWVYWIGDFTGALLAALFYLVFLSAINDNLPNRCGRTFCCCFTNIEDAFDSP